MKTNPLLGTWSLKSYVVTAATGERSTPYGEHPIGFISYAADGRMHVIGVASGRVAPGGATPADPERLALYDTMFAYAGTYSLEPGKVTHHIEVSWNEAWTGTDQIRLFERNGDTLTLSMRATDPASGTEALYVAIWESLAPQR